MLILSRGGRSYRLDAQPFDDEAALQRFISANPESIVVGEATDGARLHVLGREVPTSSGPIDVLCTDAEGRAYLVETKLYRNPDKRLVLAQVLDYGAALWAAEPSVDSLIEALRKDAGRRSLSDPVGQLAAFLEADEEAAVEHLEKVCDAVANGRFTAIVLMDRLDDRLRDLIRFMNENSRFMLLAVELDYYRHEGDEIVSPRVFGAETRRPLDRPAGRRGSWTEEQFFERLAAGTDATTVEAARKLQAFAAPLGEIWWGSGVANPSMNPYFLTGSDRSPITVAADGRIRLKLTWLGKAEHGPAFVARVTPLLAQLGLPTDHSNSTRTWWQRNQWVPHVDGLIAAFRDALPRS